MRDLCGRVVSGWLRDLTRLWDHPEVQAAVAAHDAALEANRKARATLRESDLLVDQRDAELEAVVKRLTALEPQR